MTTLTRIFRRALSTTTQTTPTVKSLCDNVYREKNLLNLVTKFKDSSQHDRFRTKSGIYSATVRRLAIAKRFDSIKSILEDQKQYADINKEGFNVRLITLYGKSKMFDDAKKVFDEMVERNVERSVLSLNALLGACVESGRNEEVEGLFRNLPKELGVEPDVWSYNAVVKGFCGLGEFRKAVGLIDEMEGKGVQADRVTFNLVLNGAYRSGKEGFEIGEEVWRRMVAKGVKPDVRCYNARLVGFGMVGKTKEAVELVEEMKSKDVKLDVFSFNALIKGFVGEGNLSEAKKWYGEIQKSKFDPDKLTFLTLIPFACEKGDLDFAFDLCKTIFDIKCLVGTGILQRVVDALFKESRIEDAKKLVELGKANNYRRFKLNLPIEE